MSSANSDHLISSLPSLDALYFFFLPDYSSTSSAMLNKSGKSEHKIQILWESAVSGKLMKHLKKNNIRD